MGSNTSASLNIFLSLSKLPGFVDELFWSPTPLEVCIATQFPAQAHDSIDTNSQSWQPACNTVLTKGCVNICMHKPIASQVHHGGPAVNIAKQDKGLVCSKQTPIGTKNLNNRRQK